MVWRGRERRGELRYETDREIILAIVCASGSLVVALLILVGEVTVPRLRGALGVDFGFTSSLS